MQEISRIFVLDKVRIRQAKNNNAVPGVTHVLKRNVKLGLHQSMEDSSMEAMSKKKTVFINISFEIFPLIKTIIYIKDSSRDPINPLKNYPTH